MTLIIIALLTLSALALLGSLFFLYRYLTRSHVFPQLPRVWRVEKKRFLMCLAGFILFFAAFLLTSWSSIPESDITVIDQTLPAVDRPSFDGAPPPEERALPPRAADDSPAPAPAATDAAARAAAGADGASSAPPENLPPTAHQPPAPALNQPAPPEQRDIAPLSPAEEVEPPLPASVPSADRAGAPANPTPEDGAQRRDDTGGKPGEAAEQPGEQSGEQPGPAKPYTSEGSRPAPQPRPYVPDDNRPSDAASSPAGPLSGGYSVCVSSYSSEEAARRDQALYRKLGRVFIVAADIPGKGRWYRICVGQYGSRNQAQNQAGQWRSNGTAQGAFVVTLPDS
jgi:hypothetical protein